MYIHAHTYTHTHSHTQTYTHTHTCVYNIYRRAINYPPRGIGEATQEAFFKIHETFGDISSDFEWTAPVLDLLFLVGSVAERKAATPKPKAARRKKRIEDEPEEIVEDDLKESDGDSYSYRLLEDDDSALKNGQTKEAKEILSSLSARQLKTLSGASKYVQICDVACIVSCHVMSCHVISCQTIHCHVMSCHVMSCHVMSCHVMSYLVRPYIVMSCHIL